jgi:hypothetical protein
VVNARSYANWTRQQRNVETLRRFYNGLYVADSPDADEHESYDNMVIPTRQRGAWEQLAMLSSHSRENGQSAAP